MSTDEAIALAERLVSVLDEAAPILGMGISLAKKAYQDHGEEGARAHLAALLEAEAQAAARARWG